MSTSRSYGDGRRMTLDEAIQRRERVIRVYGGLAITVPCARQQDRRWLSPVCQAPTCVGLGTSNGRIGSAGLAGEVGMLDGVPVAMCSNCRSLAMPGGLG